MSLLGIDISAYQPNINWAEVATAGVDYVIIQLTQGLHYVNPLEVTEADQAKLSNIPFGFYHMGHPELNNAADEAAAFIAQIRRQDIPTAKIIPALDIEQASKAVPAGILEQWVNDFADVMSRNGFPKIIIYSNVYYLNQYLPINHSLGRFPLWQSAYIPAEPQPARGWNKITIWQNSGSATVKGIPEPVDTNYCENLTDILL